jgi:hypothetical protein
MDGVAVSRRRSSTLYWIVGSILVGVLVLVLIAVLGVWLLLRPAPPDHPAQQPTLSRVEFNAKVVGKSEQGVYDAVGPPDFTSKDSEAQYWHYRKRTKDPVTGATDMDAQLVIRDGSVKSVNY